MKHIFTSLIFFLLGIKVFSQCGPVSDYDGNVYSVVTIGSQCWMQENLKTSHYASGVVIAEIEDSTTWANAFNNNTHAPAYCYYNHDSTNNAIYGKLYNWYAVMDSNQLCPTGWHVPTDTEWLQLSDYLGGNAVSAGHLKAIDSLWRAPNTGADDSSGFMGLPGGYVTANTRFGMINNTAEFWSSTVWSGNANDAWDFSLYYSAVNSTNVVDELGSGFSVRCIKNSPATGLGNIENKLNDMFAVFPNPSSGNFAIRINLEQEQACEFEILDVVGKLVAKYTYQQPAGVSRLNFNIPANGIYFVRMTENNYSTTQKLVIE